MSDYCYFCGKAGANYSMKRPGYATEEVSIHKGCYLAPKAEGPARNEPEQSPSLPSGSPSGVVEAQITFVIERLDRGDDINGDAAKYLAGWLKLALAPQGAVPADTRADEWNRLWGPVIDEVQKHGHKAGVRLGASISDWVLALVKERIAEAQGVEAPRKQRGK